MSFPFGSPSSAPANSSLTSGFSFGANKPATPGFGLTGAAQPSTGLFGSTPATSASAFGSTTPAFGATSGFGQGSAAGFGSTATPGFGATSAAPTFGAGSTPAFGATSTASAFGTSAAAAFGSTPAFGATSTAPTFGASSTPAFGATSTPAFGAVSAAPAFGATTTPAFGAAGTSAFGTGLGTGGLNFGAGSNTSTAGTGLTLGAPTTTSAGLGGLGGFGFNNASQPGLFGTTTTTTSTGLFGAKLGTTTVTGTLPSTSATPSLGLGGVAPAGTAGGGVSAAEAPKQSKLPNEISSTVDSFKDFVKKQKSLSSEIMRVSDKPLHKVWRCAETQLRGAAALLSEVSRARAHSRRLRAAAAAALAAAERLAAPHTDLMLELEGSAPPAYVKELISELEQQLSAFKRQMDVADKQMRASPKLLTEQEVTLGIRRMHEAGVALAARLQAASAAVARQKEQYLNLRKYVLKDPTNVFDVPDAGTSLEQILRDAEGSRKKTKSGRLSGSHYGSAVLADPKAALGSIQQLAGPTPFTYFANTLSSFPNTDASAPSWQPQPQPTLNTSLSLSAAPAPTQDTATFQLQKPPGKRGKQ